MSRKRRQNITSIRNYLPSTKLLYIVMVLILILFLIHLVNIALTHGANDSTLAQYVSKYDLLEHLSRQDIEII